MLISDEEFPAIIQGTPAKQCSSFYIVVLKTKRMQAIYYLSDQQLNITKSRLDAMIFADYHSAQSFSSKLEEKYRNFFCNLDPLGYPEAIHNVNMLY